VSCRKAFLSSWVSLGDVGSNLAIKMKACNTELNNQFQCCRAEAALALCLLLTKKLVISPLHISVAEPESQEAASYGRSQSHNVMRLRRLWLLT
jgi:hypothetical protein